jgi:hypothetical protein
MPSVLATSSSSIMIAEPEVAPGIEAATPVNALPFAGTNGWDLPAFTAGGQSAERAATNPPLNLESFGPSLRK